MIGAAKRKTEVKKKITKMCFIKNIKLFKIAWLLKIGKNEVYREFKKINRFNIVIIMKTELN